MVKGHIGRGPEELGSRSKVTWVKISLMLMLAGGLTKGLTTFFFIHLTLFNEW